MLKNLKKTVLNCDSLFKKIFGKIHLRFKIMWIIVFFQETILIIHSSSYIYLKNAKKSVQNKFSNNDPNFFENDLQLFSIITQPFCLVLMRLLDLLVFPKCLLFWCAFKFKIFCFLVRSIAITIKTKQRQIIITLTWTKPGISSRQKTKNKKTSLSPAKRKLPSKIYVHWKIFERSVERSYLSSWKIYWKIYWNILIWRKQESCMEKT